MAEMKNTLGASADADRALAEGDAAGASSSLRDGDPSRTEEHPVWAIWRWLATNYKEPDPTTGEPYERVARPLVSALSEFEWCEGPFPQTIPAQAIEARQGGDAESGSVEDKSAVTIGVHHD